MTEAVTLSGASVAAVGGPGPSRRRSPLESVLRLAGATLTEECGAVLAIDYGSVGGEVAVCQTAVGVADRSELVKLELRGGAEALALLVERLAGARPAPGRVLPVDHAWIHPLSRVRMLVLCDPCHGRSLVERVADEVVATTGVASVDVSEDRAAILLLGPSSEALLVSPELGPGREVPSVGGVEEALVAGGPGLVMRQGPDQFLIVTDRAHAVAVWHALHEAGADHGIASVGRAALDRFDVSGRTFARQQR